MGDSYSSGSAWSDEDDKRLRDRFKGETADHKPGRGNNISSHKAINLPPKNLCGIPWRVAMALQADGWWLRSDIIWNKPNPMPESCTDRPTRSHEYIFLLTKSGTSQYWTHRDLNGTRTQPKPDYRWVRRVKKDRGLITKGVQQPGGQEQRESPVGESDIILEEINIKPEGWTPKNKMGWDRVNLWQGHDYYYDADAVREPAQYGYKNWDGDIYRSVGDGNKDAEPFSGLKLKGCDPSTGRNLRSVWSFSTQPWPGAHFATFPEELVRRCILAGTAEQACPTCGAAWEKVTGKGERRITPAMKVAGCNRDGRYRGSETKEYSQASAQKPSESKKRILESMAYPIETLGFRPTCDCPDNDGSGRCIALDPFMGSGTVAYVALKLGRDYIGCELKPEYIKMITKRLKPLGNRPCPQQVEII